MFAENMVFFYEVWLRSMVKWFKIYILKKNNRTEEHVKNFIFCLTPSRIFRDYFIYKRNEDMNEKKKLTKRKTIRRKKIEIIMLKVPNI